MDNKELMVRSLKGLWVGDCIGNIGQLYYAHDILKALDEGMMKFGGDNINPMSQHFQFSDDTEEAIVLVNHLDKNKEVKQDDLAMEFARRYYLRDRDGELYGYGLMTRTVLREIYQGKPWRLANQTKPKVEGPSFVDKMLVGIAEGKSINQSMEEVNVELQKKVKDNPTLKVGSCGNGSAMRVAPLGAYFSRSLPETIVEQATLQSEVTHCHPEGIAGAIAVSMMSFMISEWVQNMNSEYERGWSICGVNEYTRDTLYDILLDYVPQGQVYDGIVRAKSLPDHTPISVLIEKLGNGTHVTCQDTVPLCIFLTIRALTQYKIEEMYEKVMIETCQCFGDVDTNCAIVGGMIGVISQPPEKWVRYCQPMDGVLDIPEKPQLQKPINKRFTKEQKTAMKDAIANTRPWVGGDGLVEDQAASLYETAKVISDATRKPQPTFEEVLAARKKELGMV